MVAYMVPERHIAPADHRVHLGVAVYETQTPYRR